MAAQIRVFSLPRGKLLRVYNESLEVLEEMQALGTLGLDTIEFGRYGKGSLSCRRWRMKNRWRIVERGNRRRNLYWTAEG
jgi:hypothetical protein